MNRIIFIRHGHRLDYHNPLIYLNEYLNELWDCGLTEEGKIKTKHESKNLSKPLHIVTSPWKRCIETAEIIAQEHNMTIIEDWLLGEYEKTEETIERYPMGRPTFHEPTNLLFPRPETKYNLSFRVRHGILGYLIHKYPNAIFVTHKGIIEEIYFQIADKHCDPVNYLSYITICNNEITNPTPGYQDFISQIINNYLLFSSAAIGFVISFYYLSK